VEKVEERIKDWKYFGCKTFDVDGKVKTFFKHKI